MHSLLINHVFITQVTELNGIIRRILNETINYLPRKGNREKRIDIQHERIPQTNFST